MPRSINYRPSLIDELITNERLNSYASVFKHADDAELVGAYIWNMHVCASLYPLLTTAEVTLRNSIDTALTRSLGRFWWSQNRLHYKSFSQGRNEPFVVSAIKQNFSKAFNQVTRDKRDRYSIRNARPTHHEIIAKTEFSTWEFILDHEFMGPNLIWPAQLGSVFRGVWPTSRAANMLSSTKDLVKTIREFRNRVSHHEPVWKRFSVHTEQDAITHLHEKIDKIKQLVLLISPEKEQLVIRSGLLSSAERMCSISELRRFQHNIETVKIKSIAKLSKLSQKASDENAVKKIVLYKYGKTQFLLHPD
uniref:Tiorf34 protein n=1 Tax=Rheinheimera sp. BAL341 TaxID=1708203 RepID=A0A486XVQ3_9GAMM